MFTAAATFVACENAPEGNVTPNATGKPIEITIGDESRVMLGEDGETITWKVGDVLGLFHVINGEVSPTGNNSTYTVTKVSEDGKTATITGDATWSGDEDDTHEFYIYYSRRNNEDATPTALLKTLTSAQKYNTDLSAWDNFGNYIFAYGQAKDVEYGQAIAFDAIAPYFGMLRLNITNNTGKDITISEVNLANETEFMVGTHSIDLTTPNAPIVYTQNQKKSIPLAITNGEVAAGESIDVRFLVSAKDYSDVDFTVTVTSDQGIHPTVSFKGGNIGYGARASKSITIEAAPTSAYKIGDVFNNEGVIFWISADKQQAKIVSPFAKKGSTINYSSEVFTSPEGYRATDANDGTANVTKMKAYASEYEKVFTSYFPAAAYCESLGEGWYLPAWSELKTIVAAYVGAENPSSSKYDSLFSTTWSDYATQRENFDNALKSITDGVGLAEGAGDIYVLCSTETGNGEKAKGIYFTQFKKSDGFAKYAKAGRAARCIKVVDLTK